MNTVLEPLPQLTAQQLCDALRAGVYQLYRSADHINHINVFPVPDGDTGTNMAMTMATVLAALERDTWTHSGTLLTRAADAALDGARGNSGAILAQFFQGMADRATAFERLALADFSAALTAGAASARLALTEPREGTILSVISTSAQSLTRITSRGITDYRRAFAQLMADVRASLEDTQRQLEELRAAKVVDAGAAGFVEVLQGFAAFLDTGEVRASLSPVHAGDEVMVQGGHTGEHRYCTECLIAGRSIELRRVRERLNAMGSSLVVSGHPAKLRIHIHCNDPEQVFAVAGEFGAVSAQKADDMLKQASAAHHDQRRRIAVVTDSAADVPADALEQLDIHMVPVRVHFGAHSYLDKVALAHDEFYRLLESSPDHPKTSQPPPGDFRRMFEFLASHYQGVVSVNLTSRASGTYGAAKTAADRVGDDRVTVVDSRNASLGQGLIAMAAAECAAAGGDRDAVLRAAEAARDCTRVYALLARVDYVVRGGRVPKFVGVLADLLRCSPVLTNYPDGRVGVGSVIWSRRRARQRFTSFIRRKLLPGRSYRIAVGHGNAAADARQLLNDICAGMPGIAQTHLTDIGPALSVHGGPGLLVVAVQPLPAS